MGRVACLLFFLSLSSCGKPSAAKQEPPTAPASANPVPTLSANAPSTPSTGAAPPGSAPSSTAPSGKGTCVPLSWDKDGMTAVATSFKGTIGSGEGLNGTGKTEKFQTLKLDRPACGPDKAPVASHTAHHHRPIVVEVKALATD